MRAQGMRVSLRVEQKYCLPMGIDAASERDGGLGTPPTYSSSQAPHAPNKSNLELTVEIKHRQVVRNSPGAGRKISKRICRGHFVTGCECYDPVTIDCRKRGATRATCGRSSFSN